MSTAAAVRISVANHFEITAAFAPLRICQKRIRSMIFFAAAVRISAANHFEITAVFAPLRICQKRIR